MLVCLLLSHKYRNHVRQTTNPSCTNWYIVLYYMVKNLRLDGVVNLIIDDTILLLITRE